MDTITENLTKQLSERLKILESPRDIVDSLRELSRLTNGKVMVHLVSTPKSSRQRDMWFNPKAMQDELDNPKSHGNIYVKLFTDIEQNNLRVMESSLLEDNSGANISLSELITEFGIQVGYEIEQWSYASCLVPKVSI